MKKHFLLIIAAVFAMTSAVSSAQQNPEKSFYYDYGRRFYCDVYAMPHINPDSVSVVIFYRYANSLLTFKKSGLYDANKAYVAFPQFDIEFKDTIGIIRKRISESDTLYTGEFEKTKSKTDYSTGLLRFNLPAGKYSVYAVISDDGRSKLKELNLPYLKNYSFFKLNKLCEPFYFLEENEDVLVPYIFGKNVNFSSNNTLILIPGVFTGNFIKYNYTLEYIEAKIGNVDWNDSLKIFGTLSPEMNKSLHFSLFGNSLKSTIVNDSSANKDFPGYHFGYLQIELPPDKNIPGTYELTLVQPSQKDTLKYTFRVEWEDMPLSLKTVDKAIDYMYYILTDDEYKAMKKGNERKMFRNLLDYWRKKDPTPYTVYNETMTEYFRRVDYAFFNYQTITEKDGAKTERGKIYILFGKPAKTNRTIAGNGVIKETWTYPAEKKEFVFETNGRGQFNLVKDINLK